jgi:hypothetical protein
MHRLRIIQRHLYCVLVAGFVVAPAVAAESSPYEARVVASGASVHSGPGEKFYPTDTLAQGDVVEVYREKPGGWLAIRPPVNSFSWVAGNDLEMRDGGLAEITSDNVVSRIGSRLNDKHNATQVRLKKGEVVEVLDEEQINDETWYKIAPPAGEFRWIQTSLVERVGPIQTVSAESTEPAGTPMTETKTDAAAPPLLPTSPVPSALPAAPATPLPPPAPPAPAASAAAPITSTATAQRVAGPVADDLSRELAGIELRLSRMVAAPVNLWNTERLQRDATQLLSRAQSPSDRQAVQVTLNKINQFNAISRRATPPTVMAGSPPVVARSPDPATGLTAGLPGATATAPGGPYDAVGVLRPVVSKRPGAPQFALVDDRGQVLSFVTPTPDMNLQPYLGRRVGVVGNRGFIAEFNRSHVTAARVTPISDRLLR